MKNKFLIVLAVLLFLIPLIVSQSMPTDITIGADAWTTGGSQPTAAVSAENFVVAITKPAIDGQKTFGLEEEIQFEGEFVGSGSADNWNWNFGDSAPIAQGKSTTHKYSKAGKYNVKLSVTSEGKQATATIALEIKEKPVSKECTNILQCLAMIDKLFVEGIFGK